MTTRKFDYRVSSSEFPQRLTELYAEAYFAERLTDVPLDTTVFVRQVVSLAKLTELESQAVFAVHFEGVRLSELRSYLHPWALTAYSSGISRLYQVFYREKLLEKRALSPFLKKSRVIR